LIKRLADKVAIDHAHCGAGLFTLICVLHLRA